MLDPVIAAADIFFLTPSVSAVVKATGGSNAVVIAVIIVTIITKQNLITVISSSLFTSLDGYGPEAEKLGNTTLLVSH